MKSLQTLALFLFISLTCFGQDTIYLTNPTAYTTFVGMEDVNSLTMLSEDRFIVAYGGGTDLVNGKIRVGMIDQDSIITFEDPYAFMEDMTPNGVEVYRLSDSTFLLTSSINFSFEINVVTVTHENEIIIESSTLLSTSYSDLLVLSDSVFVAAYYDSNTSSGKCVLGKIKGSLEVSIDSSYSFSDLSIDNSSFMSLDTLSSTKFVLAFGYFRGNSVIGTIDDQSVISFGEVSEFSSSTIYFIDAIGMSDTSYAVVYSDVGFSMKGTVVLGSIDTNQNITYSDKSYFSDKETRGISATKLTSDELIIAFANSGDDQNGYLVRAHMLVDTINFEERIMYNKLSSVACNPISKIDEKRFIVMYPDFDSSLGYVSLGLISEKVIPTFNELDLTETYSIYPNPAQDYLHIEFNRNEGHISLKLIDMQGRVLLSNRYESNRVSLSLEEFENGIYFVHIENDVNTFVKRIVIL
ncbi:MAG: T9SS type A sorting domain-containing protein [Bacteroidales bacterium]|nr:T9SS type A sorting domain-containing protein [Bacteroidales bacterium]